MRRHIHRARKKNRGGDSKENPQVRPLVELLKCNFYIPRYQRGYRWGKQEITELLDDLLHYYNILKQINPFYCLQPIVVKKRSWTTNDEQKISGWEVIDGQQRLTTLLVILNYLETIASKSMKEKLGEDINFFTLDFETRIHCKDFFQNKTYKRGIDHTNIDFYHISKAYKHIGGWFDHTKRNGVANASNIILDMLLGSQQNVSVIWYEYAVQRTNKLKEDDDSSIDMFTRLNEENIPLTNAELIKALLLKSDIYPAREKKFVNQRISVISSQWDEIEAKLKDEKMWCFINDLYYQPTSKIEFLFEMLAEKWNGYENQTLVQYDPEKGTPRHFEFIVFEKYLTQVKECFTNNLSDQSHVLDPINEIWSEIKDQFAIIDEWYNNHTLYHYIGFLLTVNNENKKALLKELIELRVDKDVFLNHIKNKIAHEVNFDKKLNNLEYGKDNVAIIKMLLLMDIETLVKQKAENARLPFHLYKKDEINIIEHINPQIRPSIDTDKERATTWLKYHKESLMMLKKRGSNNEEAEIDHLLSQFNRLLKEFNKEEFQDVFMKTIELNNKIAGMNENEIHTLHNLTLIDKETNSQLNNSFFDVKRMLLKENSTKKYVPIHTQRVFSKHYSEKPQEMSFWNTDDKQEYFAAIKKVHDSYIQLLSQNNEI